jgi:hypothetical protein
LTVIVFDAVAEHPAVVPVTVYVVVVAGINETPLLTPPDHAYVVAPPPVSVVDCPAQSVVTLAFAVTEGIALTVIVFDAVAEHPDVVPVTVYVVVVAGINETPLVIPPDHAYVVAPPPVSVVDCPSQSIAALAFAVTEGIALTVIVFDAVAEHPAVVPVTV